MIIAFCLNTGKDFRLQDPLSLIAVFLGTSLTSHSFEEYTNIT